MYKIKCDDLTLYNPLNNDLVVGSPSLSLEVNKVGSLNFTIYPNHDHFSAIKKMESIITVLQDDNVIFKGRVYSDKVNFYKVKKVEVEGLLAYFNDSIVRPYSFTGSVVEYVTFLINQHNEQVSDAQKFKLGTVTVTDPNDYIVRDSSSSPNTWSEINEKLIKLLGGYIVIRYEADGNYIDYLADFDDTSTQKIEFAINLLDLESEVKGDTLATCVIPYGAKIEKSNTEEATPQTDETETVEDERVTIKSVNGGVDFIQNDEAVAKYGKIYEVVTWEDVTDPANLLTKAREYLSNSIRLESKLTIKAVDLHLSDKTIEAFRIGEYIRVYSAPHNIEERLLLTDYSMDISSPSSFTFTLGLEKSSLLDNQISTDRDVANTIDTVNKDIGNLKSSTEISAKETLAYVNEVVENSREFTRTLLEEYSKSSDLEDLNTKLSTMIEQTASAITFNFNEEIERINKANGELNAQYEKISKYIRLDYGDIILGEIGNDLTTKISNGRISFIYNDSLEVAYITDSKLYITSAEILDRIVIGNFAFIPRANGNLSFKHVGANYEQSNKKV